MAQNIIINGVTYSYVPEVDIPKSGGGTAKFYDTAGASSVNAGDILAGVVVYGAGGAITGTMPDNGATGGTIGTKAGTVTIPAGKTTGGTVSLTNVTDLNLRIVPNDTKNLPFGSYLYDLELTFADGYVDTFINCASFRIVPEVD